TNDTFGPLRDLARPARRRRRGRTLTSVTAGGRWSLVSGLAAKEASPTRQAVARARLLLDRYGIVSRKAVQSEGLSGGFGPIYKVLRELEEQGRSRRGYFVDGLPGAQFAYAGAVDRLRDCRDEAEERDAVVKTDNIVTLSAMDPANPFGALVPWPDVRDSQRAKPRRVAG
ncbi:MAG: DEAD/DEAH box helicase, partial [Pseudomonadota bacterium]